MNSMQVAMKGRMAFKRRMWERIMELVVLHVVPLVRRHLYPRTGMPRLWTVLVIHPKIKRRVGLYVICRQYNSLMRGSGILVTEAAIINPHLPHGNSTEPPKTIQTLLAVQYEGAVYYTDWSCDYQPSLLSAHGARHKNNKERQNRTHCIRIEHAPCPDTPRDVSYRQIMMKERVRSAHRKLRYSHFKILGHF